MSRNSSGSLTLSKATIGFLNFKTAEGLTQRTLYSYERILVKWVEYMGDPKVTAITSKDLSGYLSWQRTEYTPERLNGKTHPAGDARFWQPGHGPSLCPGCPGRCGASAS